MNVLLRQQSRPLPSRKRQRGAEIVEVLITLPIFLLLIFTILYFSILLYDVGVITHAARVGARQASLYWVDPDRNLYEPINNSSEYVFFEKSMVDGDETEVAAILGQLIAASPPDGLVRGYIEPAGTELDSEAVPVRTLSGALGPAELSICGNQPCYQNDGGIRIEIGYDQYEGLINIRWIKDTMNIVRSMQSRPEADF